MLMQVVGVSLLALFVFVGPLVSVSPLSVFFLSGFLTGGAHGFLYPALSALLVDETPEARRGRAVGIFSSCVLLGNTVGAVLSGYIASGLGYGVMFTFLTAVLLGGFVLSLRLKP
jgi:MFS family permease